MFLMRMLSTVSHLGFVDFLDEEVDFLCCCCFVEEGFSFLASLKMASAVSPAVSLAALWLSSSWGNESAGLGFAARFARRRVVGP